MFSKALAALFVVAAANVAMAYPTVKCEITTGDGDLEPIQVQSTATFEAYSQKFMSYGDQNIDVYSGQNADGTYFISIYCPNNGLVVNGNGHLSYFDSLHEFKVSCDVGR